VLTGHSKGRSYRSVRPIGGVFWPIGRTGWPDDVQVGPADSMIVPSEFRSRPRGGTVLRDDSPAIGGQRRFIENWTRFLPRHQSSSAKSRSQSRLCDGRLTARRLAFAVVSRLGRRSRRFDRNGIQESTRRGDFRRSAGLGQGVFLQRPAGSRHAGPVFAR